MKFIGIIIFTFSLIFLSSCCNNISKENRNSNESNKSIKKEQPAHIAENQSIVTAQLEQIVSQSDSEFSIKAKILKVEDNPAFLSIAVAGESYLLKPNLQLDSKKKIMDSDRNKKLLELVNLKPGDKFNCIIFYEQNQGWLIEKVL